MTNPDTQIAKEINYARRLRAEADQLSAASLARKFGVARDGETDKQAEKRVLNIIYSRNWHEDMELISECWDERQRVRQEMQEYSYKAIAARHACSESVVRRVAQKTETER